ncbi:hypothetical protein [uncultured Lamprocystis sp.]|uniref:YfaP family protein n=5 Tax=uncultured Lamprocystis sp. TaxID=543132 RepID=UPI0025E3CEEF|nr:hypothetical protein [uncultured Lamprocystis sp.]
MLNKFFGRVSRKSLYFGIFGMIGAAIGSALGQLPFLLVEHQGIVLSDNIIETQQRVQQAGGKSGLVQISLMWNNRNDLDLYVTDPTGEIIYFSHKKAGSGGELDVDRNVGGETETPVENVVWTNSPPDGDYQVHVRFFAKKNGAELATPFLVVVKNSDRIDEFHGTVTAPNDKPLVTTFRYSGVAADNHVVDGSWIVSFWGLCVAMGMALLLVIGQRKFLRQPLFPLKELALTAGGGAIAGLVSGWLANYAFVLLLPRFLAWVVFGLLIGLVLTRVVPNLKPKVGLVGGSLGGLVGGISFSFITIIYGDDLGRAAGAVAVGFFIGVMVALFEDYFKEAWIEIFWSPKERSTISLGERDLVIGSSADADVYLRKDLGFPDVLGTIKLDRGRVVYVDHRNRKETELKNESKIKMGEIEIMVRCA